MSAWRGRPDESCSTVHTLNNVPSADLPDSWDLLFLNEKKGAPLLLRISKSHESAVANTLQKLSKCDDFRTRGHESGESELQGAAATRLWSHKVVKLVSSRLESIFQHM